MHMGLAQVHLMVSSHQWNPTRRMKLRHTSALIIVLNMVLGIIFLLKAYVFTKLLPHQTVQGIRSLFFCLHHFLLLSFHIILNQPRLKWRVSQFVIKKVTKYILV